MVGVAPSGKNIYRWTTALQNEPTGIIFSNHGSPQTSDFAFVNGGYYTESGLLGIVSSTVINGDVNGDGSVTSADITALYDILLGVNNDHIATADVDGDGNITSADVTTVYSIMLGQQ